MLSFALLAIASVLNFDRSTVKHALQNTQNYYHQWLSHSFRGHQILFAFPRPLASLGALLQIGKGKEMEGRKGEGTVP